MTALRAERFGAALTLFDVSRAAGISSYRVSLIERDLVEATPEELARLHEAIARLATEPRS